MAGRELPGQMVDARIRIQVMIVTVTQKFTEPLQNGGENLPCQD